MTDITIKQEDQDELQPFVAAIMGTLDAQLLTAKTKILTRSQLVSFVADKLSESARIKAKKIEDSWHEKRYRIPDAIKTKVQAKLDRLVLELKRATGYDDYRSGESMKIDELWFIDMLSMKENDLPTKMVVISDIYYKQRDKYGWETSDRHYVKVGVTKAFLHELRDGVGRDYLKLSRYQQLSSYRATDRQRIAKLVLNSVPGGKDVFALVDRLGASLDKALEILPGEKIKSIDYDG